ncbi:MAG: hypothetical protein OEY56_01660 [Cyclobacteriaceae bacterium]|nr:hypothetical protein [Cyclobacteriaceae bacterium]
MSPIKKKESGEIIYLLVGIMLITLGVFMISKGLVVGGFDYLAQQPTAYGGSLLIVVGIVFLVVYYYTLSPFGKVRRFFENSKNKKK